MRIGVDLGGTKIAIVVLDAEGDSVHTDRVATPHQDYGATLLAIVRLIQEAEAKVGTRCTIGIGTPGAISPATGRMKNCNSTWLNDRSLQQDLESKLGSRSIRLANDANCFALSEAVDGSAAGCSLVFGVILGTGVGGGLALQAQPWIGPNAIGGEWGHNPLPAPQGDELPGPSCYCGRSGCIETFLSGPGLERLHLERTGQEQSGREIAAAAERAELADSGQSNPDSTGHREDRAALETLSIYEDRLARALGTVVNLLDPDCIVLGGGLSAISRLYTQIPRIWGRYIFSDRVDTPLRAPRFGDASGVRGAAWLWGR